MVGSPAYMSPEQMRAIRDVDARSDIWSLGVILHEMVAGERPFRADSLPDLCFEVLSGRPVVVRLPGQPRLAAIVARCLAREPGDRYATVGELARDVTAAARAPVVPVAETVAVEVATPRTELPSARGRSGPAFIALGLLAAGVVAAVAFRPDRSRPQSFAHPPPGYSGAPAPTPAPGPETGPDIELDIKVKPAGAEVYYDGQRLGVAPGVFRVTRGSTRKWLELRMPGYPRWMLPITPSRSWVIPVELEKRRPHQYVSPE
jgi:hypothetical protein